MQRHVSGKDAFYFVVWTLAAMMVGAVMYSKWGPKPEIPLYSVVHEYRMPVLGWSKQECRRICDTQARMSAVRKSSRTY